MTRHRLMLSLLLLVALAPGPVCAEGEPEWVRPEVTGIQVELTAVSTAEPDALVPPGERYAAVLEADGTLHHGPAGGPGPLDVVEPSSLEASLTPVRRRLGEGRTGRTRLWIRADRRARWIQALWLMQAAADEDVRVSLIEFAVDGPGAGHGVLRHQLPASGALAPTRSDVRLRHLVVSLEGAPGASVGTVRLLNADGGQITSLPGTPGAAVVLRSLLDGMRSPAVRFGARVDLTRSGADRFTFGNVLPLIVALRQAEADITFGNAPDLELPPDEARPPASPTPAVAMTGPRNPETKPVARERPTELAPPVETPPGSDATPLPGPARSEQRIEAVEHALRWLGAHQSPDGHWGARDFRLWCDGTRTTAGPDGEGRSVYDVGVTGLAVLAFLSAGYTARGRHTHAGTVRRSLRYLKGVQDPEGCFGERTDLRWIYNHAIASLAMLEAFGMDGGPHHRASAQAGLTFSARCRNPSLAWRYAVRPRDSDTSVTGWMTLGVEAARRINEYAMQGGAQAPLTIDASAFEGIRAWIERMTDRKSGRVGYYMRGSGPARPSELFHLFPGEKVEPMTSVGVLLRVLLGEDPATSDPIRRGVDLIAGLPPRWDSEAGTVDLYYWHWGGLAMHQVGGRQGSEWHSALEREVLGAQRTDGVPCTTLGSWDPAGPWGPDGGRVYATALCVLCLEADRRYPRRFPR